MAGTVTKNPVIKRTLNQERSVLAMARKIKPQGQGQVKERAPLAGRVALVTGGAVRLGQAITLALAREGCRVAIHYHRSAGAARATAREARRLGSEATLIRGDLADPATARRLVAETVRGLGGLDLLVNNAGIFLETPFLDATVAQWDRLLAVNLRGPFLASQAAARWMVKRRAGRIINIADVGGIKPWPSYLPYCVTKAGLLMLTRGLAIALAPHVQVNGVAPGAVLFPETFPAGLRRKIRQAIPAGREGSPEDVAAAVVFFATAPSYLTGQTICVDGGVSAR